MHGCVWLFATLWTIACRDPQSMGFSRQEYWSGLPFSSPGDLPNPGIEHRSPTFQADAITSAIREALHCRQTLYPLSLPDPNPSTFHPSPCPRGGRCAKPESCWQIRHWAPDLQALWERRPGTTPCLCSAAWLWTRIHLADSQFLHQETQEEKQPLRYLKS